MLRPAEAIDQKKEFCDCEFSWEMEGGAHGVSEGKNLHAVPTPAQKNCPKEECTVENAARIPCRQVLGTYRVQFERREKRKRQQARPGKSGMKRICAAHRGAAIKL